MIYFLRPFLAVTVAAFAYFTYWRLWCWSGVPQRALREGPIGYLRLVGAWCLVLVVYAFVAETSGKPFTWNWLVECILLWDWVFVVISSPVLALAECLWRRRYRSIIDLWNKTDA